MQPSKSLFAILSATTLFSITTLSADSAKKQPAQTPPPPYDADLFNKDKEVSFVTGELLVWHVNEGATDYAIKMNQPAWSSTLTTAAIGNYQNAEFNWSPGMRVALGYFNAPHFWDIFVQYTFVPASGTSEAKAPTAADQFLNGTWVHPAANFPSPALRKAESDINLDYHLADLLVSRRFHPNEHFRLNLFGGITAGFLYQNWKVNYEDTVGGRSKIQNNWQFMGVGPRLGLKVDWFMRCDFYLTGLFSNAILAGWYRNSAFQNTTTPTVDADISLPFRDSHFSDTRLTYTAQFLVGPSWQKRFERVRTELIVGYEFTVWTNLHQIYRSVFDAATGPHETLINDSLVSLQGVTVRLNVDF